MDEPSRERIRSVLSQNLDWSHILAAAARHGIQPLLYWHLSHFEESLVPSSLIKTLYDAFEQNAIWNLRVLFELQRILRALNEHKVTAVPIKGSAVAFTLYKHIGLRHSLDVDILILPEDAPQALRVLRALDYQDHSGANFQHTFTRDRALFVDVQWRNTCLRYPSDVTLWNRLQKAELGGTSVSLLSPEDALLLTCEHAAIHQWHFLKWICDVAELVKQNHDIVWDDLMTRVHAVKRVRMLQLGLLLAADLLDAPVPDAVSSQVKNERSLISLADSIKHSLLTCASEPSFIRQAAFKLRTREDTLERFRYITCTLINRATSPYFSMRLPPAWLSHF